MSLKLGVIFTAIDCLIIKFLFNFKCKQECKYANKYLSYNNGLLSEILA